MLLMPKRVKYRKIQKGRVRGAESRGLELAFGDFGLKAVETARIDTRALEAARIALTRYIESEVEEAIFRVKVPDTMEYWRARGADRLAMWRYVRERRYGPGFCSRMVRERDANWEHLREALAPFEHSLGERPFLFRTIGLADFALYGALHSLAFTGEMKIPGPALRAFFGRVDRITASLESA